MWEHGIVLFDGICNLCNGVVDFLIRKDKNDRLRFSALQSETGKAILKKFHLEGTAGQSVIFIDKGKVWRKSNAFCYIMKALPGGWKLFYYIIIVPEFIRDGVYEFISHHRHKWFGTRDTCRTPTPDERKKFLPER